MYRWHPAEGGNGNDQLGVTLRANATLKRSFGAFAVVIQWKCGIVSFSPVAVQLVTQLTSVSHVQTRSQCATDLLLLLFKVDFIDVFEKRETN